MADHHGVERRAGTADRPLLLVDDVSFAYPAAGTRSGRASPLPWVLRRLSLAVHRGELVAVLGPSGCGKSTLVQLVAGFLTPTEGRVVLDGQPVRGPGADRALVPQQTTLYPWLRVADNVALPLRVQRIPADERRRRALAALDLVGLAHVADEWPDRLSGGMQQRVMVARALVQGARLLLMDEPFGGLDALTRERLQHHLLRLWQQTGVTVLLITHDVDEAAALATRVLVMGARPGRIVSSLQLDFGRAVASGQAALHEVRSRTEFAAAVRFLRACLAA